MPGQAEARPGPLLIREDPTRRRKCFGSSSSTSGPLTIRMACKPVPLENPNVLGANNDALLPEPALERASVSAPPAGLDFFHHNLEHDDVVFADRPPAFFP